jgi:asparagine synthetase B (glutamine-hydrolysing)
MIQPADNAPNIHPLDSPRRGSLLSPLETAIGMPLGGTSPVELPDAAGLDARTALEEATLQALRDGPCWVAFSGGLDSSLVLAATVSMARRAGLDPPIALTCRFPAAPETHEDHWQRRVIEHLGHERWVQIELHDELDLLGEAATSALRRFGPYWPANAHFMLLLAAHAGGGTLISGQGGDELFAWWRWQRAAAVIAGGALRARDLAELALALSPRRVRRAHDRRRVERLPWLTEGAAEAYRRAIGGFADCPLRWDRQLGWMRSRGEVSHALDTVVEMCASAGVRYGAPMLDPRFLAAVAAAGGATGFGGRQQMLQRLFAGLLPGDVLARRDKASFNSVSFGPAARSFASRWTGEGVDPVLVEPDELRRTWLAPMVDWRSANLLQQAWLFEA